MKTKMLETSYRPNRLTAVFEMILVFLLLGVCMAGGFGLTSAHAGTEILFYPLARAFGSPSEHELVRCRAAFKQMQTNFDKSRVVVVPVLFADADTDAKNGQWRSDLAAAEMRDIAVQTTAKIEVSATGPKVALPKPFHNQLGYLTKRSSVYGSWVKATHPPGDYVFVSEIFGCKGIVYAIQIYVFDSSGQLAYSRLLNSHQFGPKLSLTGEDAVKRIVNTFLKNLKDDVKKVFPPYGVG
jgi:hypothetical protein